MNNKLHCIRCDKALDDISTYQPNDGVCFTSYGHYGSTVFDPLDGSRMEIVVCDECLESAKTKRIVEPALAPDFKINEYAVEQAMFASPKNLFMRNGDVYNQCTLSDEDIRNIVTAYHEAEKENPLDMPSAWVFDND